jgi:hypothetical protein
MAQCKSRGATAETGQQLIRLELDSHADDAVTVGFGLEPNPWLVMTIEPLPQLGRQSLPSAS